MTLTALRVLLIAALGATLLQAQAPAPPMPSGTNVLLGRVVEIGTDAPVGGAMVTLIGHFDASGKPSTPSPIARGPESPPSLSVMTTADGYFVFRNLPAGLFTAATRAHGYMNNDFPPTVVEIRDSQKPTELQLRVWKYAAITRPKSRGASSTPPAGLSLATRSLSSRRIDRSGSRTPVAFDWPSRRRMDPSRSVTCPPASTPSLR